MTADFIPSAKEPYQRQMTSYRRTRSAILEGAKSLIASVGLQKTNMIEIADVSQVSRATLYNHFRDKKSVLRALLESEVERVIQFIDSDQSLVDSLSQISHEISSDPALAMMRSTDPAVLAGLLSGTEDLLWVHVRSELFRLIGNKRVAEVARLWLVGQVLQPVSFEESREQARIISQLKS